MVQVFARSESGKEVRKVVQRLNLARGTAAEEYEQTRAEKDEECGSEEPREEVIPLVAPSQSRWRHLAQAIDVAEGRIALHEVQDKEADSAEDQQFVTSVPDMNSMKRGRKRTRKNVTSLGGEESERTEPAPYVKRGKQAGRAGSSRNERSWSKGNYRDRLQTQTAPIEPPKENNRAVARPSDDGGLFTTMDGDVAFEEEYM